MPDTIRISKFGERVLEVFYTQFRIHYTKDNIRDAYRKLRSFDGLLSAIGVSLKLNIPLDEAAEVMSMEME